MRNTLLAGATILVFGCGGGPTAEIVVDSPQYLPTSMIAGAIVNHGSVGVSYSYCFFQIEQTDGEFTSHVSPHPEANCDFAGSDGFVAPGETETFLAQVPAEVPPGIYVLVNRMHPTSQPPFGQPAPFDVQSEPFEVL